MDSMTQKARSARGYLVLRTAQGTSKQKRIAVLAKQTKSLHKISVVVFAPVDKQLLVNYTKELKLSTNRESQMRTLTLSRCSKSNPTERPQL